MACLITILVLACKTTEFKFWGVSVFRGEQRFSQETYVGAYPGCQALGVCKQ